MPSGDNPRRRSPGYEAAGLETPIRELTNLTLRANTLADPFQAPLRDRRGAPHRIDGATAHTATGRGKGLAKPCRGTPARCSPSFPAGSAAWALC